MNTRTINAMFHRSTGMEVAQVAELVGVVTMAIRQALAGGKRMGGITVQHVRTICLLWLVDSMGWWERSS